jgi:hypothetical protein
MSEGGGSRASGDSGHLASYHHIADLARLEYYEKKNSIHNEIAFLQPQLTFLINRRDQLTRNLTILYGRNFSVLKNIPSLNELNSLNYQIRHFSGMINSLRTELSRLGPSPQVSDDRTLSRRSGGNGSVSSRGSGGPVRRNYNNHEVTSKFRPYNFGKKRNQFKLSTLMADLKKLNKI